MYMTLYGRLVEPLEVGKISNNNIIHSFKLREHACVTLTHRDSENFGEHFYSWSTFSANSKGGEEL